jgi:hypothetical protein
MAAPIPTAEPAFVVAGDTVKWTRSLADYPASDGWVLKYRLINAAGNVDIVSTASGADHLVNVAASTTDNWAPGTYAWAAYVERSGERYTVDSGTIVVRPDLAAQAAGFEARSNARQILEQLETAFKDYVVNGQGLVQRYTIGGREMWFRSSKDFVQQIEYWRKQVQDEASFDSVARGLGNPRRLFARFG